MRTYILKRLLLMVPTLVGITLLTYAIVRLAPGDPVGAMIRMQAGNVNPRVFEREADRIRQRLGLKDYNFWGQDPDRIDAAEKIVNAFYGYGRWVWHMAQGDFGESMQQRTTEGSKDPLDLYVERAHVSVILNLIAEVLIFLIAVPVGLMAARYSGRLFDRGSTIVLLGLWSLPQVLAGTLLLSLLARGGIGLEGFPYAGLHGAGAETMGWGEWFVDTLWHATLPVLCLVYGGLAYLAKLGRASLLENLRADYVRTARAKGLPERRVVYHHALRNSLLPMITTMVMMLPMLLGGSVVVERIFTIPGMGNLFVGAAMQRDLAVIMFGTLVYGTLALLSLLLADILYAWADPRIRYD